jgi:hypothetical protein
MTRGMVLVGFAEAMSAPEVVWSLVDQGFQVTAFARKGRRSALHHSRHVACRDITPPEMDLEAAYSDLQALMASMNGSADGGHRTLFPLDDSAVWLCSRVQLDPDWILAGPRGDNANLALDKHLQVRAALDAGFNVPKTSLVATSSELLNLVDSFPVILKPKGVLPLQNRLYKGPSWTCGNRKELERAVSSWANRTPLLVQPFILGTGEGAFGLATPDGIKAWSAHKRLRMMNPHGSGSSACISQTVPGEFKGPIERLIEKAGWRGLFMIELLRDQSGTAWFVELNGRPWGSMALARKQGLEYPAWNVELASDGNSRPVTEPLSSPGLVCRHLGRELMHPLFVLRGRNSKALTNWPSIWKAVRDIMRVHRGDTLYNWRKDDLKVLISDCYYTVRDQLFKSKE